MKHSAKKLNLTVFIEQDEDGIYVGSVPTIAGCHAQGETQEAMLANLTEVITLCLRNTNLTEARKHRFIGIQNLDVAYA